MFSKAVKKLIRDNISADRISFSRDGTTVTFKRMYFYRHGATAEAFAERIENEMRGLSLRPTGREVEDRWAPWPRDSYFMARFYFR